MDKTPFSWLSSEDAACDVGELLRPDSLIFFVQTFLILFFKGFLQNFKVLCFFIYLTTLTNILHKQSIFCTYSQRIHVW